MKSLRISLLNIVAAVVLIWLASTLWDGRVGWSTVIYTLVLVALLFTVDQLFRMMLGSLKRVWLVETIFILLSILGVWLVRYLF